MRHRTLLSVFEERVECMILEKARCVGVQRMYRIVDAVFSVLYCGWFLVPR